MVEIDSTPSKTSRAPKILKFNNYNLDLQKSLPEFPRLSGQKCSLVGLLQNIINDNSFPLVYI